MKFITWFITIAIVLLLLYTCIGSDKNVTILKERAEIEIPKRNWKILRYEGYKYGSWSRHGGTVWYHVANVDNPDIQYRVAISLWNNELQYYYNEPEVLSRIQIQHKK